MPLTFRKKVPRIGKDVQTTHGVIVAAFDAEGFEKQLRQRFQSVPIPQTVDQPRFVLCEQNFVKLIGSSTGFSARFNFCMAVRRMTFLPVENQDDERESREIDALVHHS